MTDFLTAPSERPPIENLGPKSSLPEKVGCDVVWSGKYGLCGLQRKAVPDLIASVRDSRLGKEFVQMREAKLAAAFLVIEGTFQWSSEGELLSERTAWTQRQQWGVELSAQRQGVMVLHTRNSLETVAISEYLAESTNKEHSEFSSLIVGTRPQANGWGRLTNKEYAVHVMSHLKDVSDVLAGRIFDFYGHFPCRHDIAQNPVTEIHGIGKVRAKSIAQCFGVEVSQ